VHERAILLEQLVRVSFRVRVRVRVRAS